MHIQKKKEKREEERRGKQFWKWRKAIRLSQSNWEASNTANMYAISRFLMQNTSYENRILFTRMNMQIVRKAINSLKAIAMDESF